MILSSAQSDSGSHPVVSASSPVYFLPSSHAFTHGSLLLCDMLNHSNNTETEHREQKHYHCPLKTTQMKKKNILLIMYLLFSTDSGNFCVLCIVSVIVHVTCHVEVKILVY